MRPKSGDVLQSLQFRIEAKRHGPNVLLFAGIEFGPSPARLYAACSTVQGGLGRGAIMSGGWAYQVEGGLGYDMLLRHFFKSGSVLWLGAQAAIVLLIVQSETDWTTGVARISAAKIARETGLSVRAVFTSLDRAAKLGFLERLETAPGHTGQWRVLRRVIAQAPDGEQLPISYAYAADLEPQRRKALLESLKSGDLEVLGAAGIELHVHIDQVQIVQAGGTGVQLHADAGELQRAQTHWVSIHPSEWGGRIKAAGVSDSGPITDAIKLAVFKHEVRE